MLHLPVLRWGAPYESLEKDEVVHFSTGEPIGPAHNQALQYQSCTICHTDVHGSNVSPVLFKNE